ncbi:MAG: gamma-glutamyltransferase [Alphaproteobacteria bacterium]|nr:gamma-glutamyltransferase [Alphaproteobacteria bacterium SS10]
MISTDTNHRPDQTPEAVTPQGKGVAWRVFTSVLVTISLAACGGGSSQEEISQFTTSAQAAVIADEPQAALVGRDILAQGGNPVDAAVAMALTLSVTLPSRIGLLGGGSCLVHDPSTGDDDGNDSQVTSIDFRPLPVPRADGSRSEYGSPGMLRGLFAMHARFGNLRFEQLIIPAERLARFDGQISRSLANDLEAFSDRLDSTLHPVWSGVSSDLPVGSAIPWDVTAGALALLRQDGIGVFYSGRAGREVASELGLDAEAWASTTPQILEIDGQGDLAVLNGTDRLYLPPGIAESDVVAALANIGRNQPVPAVDGDAPPATSLVVKGSGDFVVACGLTQGMAFGIGEPTGAFALWPARAVAMDLPLSDGFIGPVLIANENVGELRLAGVVSGSDDVPTPMLTGAQQLFEGQAVAAGDARRIIAQPAGGGVRRSLVSCGRANDDGDRRCSAAIDPQVRGLAITP